MNILFVCTGNTCRSPMAEALLKEKLPEINVQSAGIFAAEGDTANQHAIEVLKQRKISCNHSSQSVTKELLDWADFVLTMTMGHKHSLIIEHPDYQEKYFTLKEYVYANPDENYVESTENIKDTAESPQEESLYFHHLEANSLNNDISDPFGGDLNVYEETIKEIEEFINLLVVKIKNSQDK